MIEDQSKKAYLLLSPEYGSMGDQAIAYAQEEYIKKVYSDYKLIVLNEEESLDSAVDLSGGKNNDTLFFLQGGGNIGSLYPQLEKNRQYLLSVLKDKKVVIFPQSVYFEGDEWIQSVDIYSNPNFTIYAREKPSFELLKQYYPKAKVILKPDMVYGLADRFEFSREERSSIMISLRGDKECSFAGFREVLLNEMTKRYENVKEYKMYSGKTVKKACREEFVIQSISELADARLVITDRLHGRIFSAITKTPCIVLPCIYHKIEGNYEWIKDCKYIRYIKEADIQRILESADELMNLEKQDFDFELPKW